MKKNIIFYFYFLKIPNKRRTKKILLLHTFFSFFIFKLKNKSKVGPKLGPIIGPFAFSIKIYIH